MRKTGLNVLQLEDRCVPATWANPWPDAAHLTLSMAPDGVRAGDGTSDLFRVLDTTMPRDVWQREVLRAFQAWAIHANINIGLVADGGQAFGTPGSVQGDARFGDIRLAAAPQASDALASAAPFDFMAGTWSGDVRLNSNIRFSTGGAAGYDLYTVLLQESGHVFGLNNSLQRDSVMFEAYSGRRMGLSAADVAGLQALYGTRKPDALEGSRGNDTLATATRLNLLTNASGSLAMTATGDITTLNDSDVFSFTTPLSLSSLAIRLRTSEISLLTAKVSVYDARGNLLKSTAAIDPRTGDLELRVDGLKLLSTYYVKVEGARDDVFSIGSYQLEVRYLPLLHGLTGSLTTALGNVVNTVTDVLSNVDLHLNDSVFMASTLPLQQSLSGTDSKLDYSYNASINDSRDLDFYKVKAPTGSSTALTVMVWGTPSRLRPGAYLLPQVRVYDRLGKPVAAEVLVNDGHTFTVQVANATPGATYFVEVKAMDQQGSHNVGNYFLGVDFRSQAVVQSTLTQGTLDAAKPKETKTLTVDMSGLFHFVLSAEAASRAGVMMTIYDEAGNEVWSLGAGTGMPVSGSVSLKKGTYRLRFLGGTFDGKPLPTMNFTLRGIRLSDNNGPETMDPTSDPSGASVKNGPPPRSNPGSTEGGVESSEPYSDPYTVSDTEDWGGYWDSTTWEDSNTSTWETDDRYYYS